MPLLADPLRSHLLRLLVHDLCERGEIRYYAALRDKPGFIAALRNTIEELKRARIFPEDFAASASGMGPRLEEIARLYSAYQGWLQTQHWADNEGHGWLAAIALEADPGLGTDTRLLAVTGFDEFNPTQLAVLSLLGRRAKENSHHFKLAIYSTRTVLPIAAFGAHRTHSSKVWVFSRR